MQVTFASEVHVSIVANESLHTPLQVSILSKLNWDFDQRDFKGCLIPANCFCPGIAVSKERLSDRDAELNFGEYYLQLDLLVEGVITGNQSKVCIGLYKIRRYLVSIGLTLSDFVSRSNVFRGSNIYYEDYSFTMGNMEGQKKRTIVKCTTLHCYVPPLPTIPEGYPIPHPKDPKYDPYKMFGIHDFLKQINFKCLTDKESINNILYDLLYPYSDPETQTILMKRKWDDINYIDLANYINSKIRNDSKQDDTHSERQQGGQKEDPKIFQNCQNILNSQTAPRQSEIDFINNNLLKNCRNIDSKVRKLLEINPAIAGRNIQDFTASKDLSKIYRTTAWKELSTSKHKKT